VAWCAIADQPAGGCLPANKGVELRGVESRHRLGANEARRCEFAETMQNFLMAVRGQDEHAVMIAQRPELLFDSDSGFAGSAFERFCAAG
jgi:hypothetical protein